MPPHRSHRYNTRSRPNTDGDEPAFVLSYEPYKRRRRVDGTYFHRVYEAMIEKSSDGLGLSGLSATAFTFDAVKEDTKARMESAGGKWRNGPSNTACKDAFDLSVEHQYIVKAGEGLYQLSPIGLDKARNVVVEMEGLDDPERRRVMYKAIYREFLPTEKMRLGPARAYAKDKHGFWIRHENERLQNAQANETRHSSSQASAPQTPLRHASPAAYPTPESNERPPPRATGSQHVTPPASPSPASRSLSRPLSFIGEHPSLRRQATLPDVGHAPLSRQATLPDVLSPTLISSRPLGRHTTLPGSIASVGRQASLSRQTSLRSVVSRRSTQRSLSRAASLQRMSSLSGLSRGPSALTDTEKALLQEEVVRLTGECARLRRKIEEGENAHRRTIWTAVGHAISAHVLGREKDTLQAKLRARDVDRAELALKEAQFAELQRVMNTQTMEDLQSLRARHM